MYSLQSPLHPLHYTQMPFNSKFTVWLQHRDLWYAATHIKTLRYASNHPLFLLLSKVYQKSLPARTRAWKKKYCVYTYIEGIREEGKHKIGEIYKGDPLLVGSCIPTHECIKGIPRPGERTRVQREFTSAVFTPTCKDVWMYVSKVNMHSVHVGVRRFALHWLLFWKYIRICKFMEHIRFGPSNLNWNSTLI